jgi:DNA-directed RNA polymerase specialized sigma54-like protein
MASPFGPKQTLSQKLQQKLSPQQIQLMKLLQIPTATLEQRIQEELEANPALEEGDETADLTDTLEQSDADTAYYETEKVNPKGTIQRITATRSTILTATRPRNMPMKKPSASVTTMARNSMTI